jgi:hypothetical protein
VQWQLDVLCSRFGSASVEHARRMEQLQLDLLCSPSGSACIEARRAAAYNAMIRRFTPHPPPPPIERPVNRAMEAFFGPDSGRRVERKSCLSALKGKPSGITSKAQAAFDMSLLAAQVASPISKCAYNVAETPLSEHIIAVQ